MEDEGQRWHKSNMQGGATAQRGGRIVVQKDEPIDDETIALLTVPALLPLYWKTSSSTTLESLLFTVTRTTFLPAAPCRFTNSLAFAPNSSKLLGGVCVSKKRSAENDEDSSPASRARSAFVFSFSFSISSSRIRASLAAESTRRR